MMKPGKKEEENQVYVRKKSIKEYCRITTIIKLALFSTFVDLLNVTHKLCGRWKLFEKHEIVMSAKGMIHQSGTL